MLLTLKYTVVFKKNQWLPFEVLRIFQLLWWVHATERSWRWSSIMRLFPLSTGVYRVSYCRRKQNKVRWLLPDLNVLSSTATSYPPFSNSPTFCKDCSLALYLLFLHSLSSFLEENLSRCFLSSPHQHNLCLNVPLTINKPNNFNSYNVFSVCLGPPCILYIFSLFIFTATQHGLNYCKPCTTDTWQKITPI